MIHKDYKGRNIEGYWKSPPHIVTMTTSNGSTITREMISSRDKVEYPIPVPNVVSPIEANEIYELIRLKEKTAKEIGYKGSSESRITGERLGSHEYQTDEWIWPEDFAPHYVLVHGVKPTDEFLEYIGYRSNRLLKARRTGWNKY